MKQMTTDHYGYRPSSQSWIFADRIFSWNAGRNEMTSSREHLDIRIEGEDLPAPVLGNLSPGFGAGGFLMLSEWLLHSFSGYDGWLALGQALSYAVHPELIALKLFNRFVPGLWIHGPSRTGKTAIGSRLMQIWGFNESDCTHSSRITPNRLARLLSCYSALPVCVDDLDFYYKNNRDEWIPKEYCLLLDWDAQTVPFTAPLKTVPILISELGIPDSLKDSYLTVRTLQLNSLEEQERIFNPDYYNVRLRAIGYFLMKNRVEFARRFLDRLHFFNPVEKTDLRVGVPWAAWTAAAELTREWIPRHGPLSDDLAALLTASHQRRFEDHVLDRLTQSGAPTLRFHFTR